jgi:hypothetical protein
MALGINAAAKLTAHYLQSDERMAVMWWGKPGIGKTDALYQLGNTLQRPVMLWSANIHESVDLRGLPAVDRDEYGNAVTARWLAPADLPHADRDGENGILFLDDVLTAPPALQAPLFGLALTGRVGEYVLPKGWQCVGASNYTTDKAGASRINSALANRFAHVEIEPTIDDWAMWANAHPDCVPPELLAFIRFKPALLHDSKVINATGAFPSPRAWSKVGRCLNMGGLDQTMRFHMIQGLVGEGAATELQSFLNVMTELPTVEDCIKFPTTTRVPINLAAQHAISTGLGRIADKKNFAAILQYMQRVGDEFMMMTVLDATKRDRAVTMTKAYIDWAAKNNHLIS